MATAKWTLQWDVTLIAVIKKQTGLVWAQHELKVKCFYRHCVGNWVYLEDIGCISDLSCCHGSAVWR